MPDALPLLHVPTPTHGIAWIERYLQEELALRNASTVEAYQRVLRDFAAWLATKPGSQGQFIPQAMIRTALKTYFEEKKAETRPLSKGEQAQTRAGQLSPFGRPPRYGPTSLVRMKVALSGFADWLIEQGELAANPTRGLSLPTMASRPPRVLKDGQRFALRSVVERATMPQMRRGKLVEESADLRGAAIFALGYYAGFRVSDVSHLLLRNTHIGPKVGWVLVGYKQEKYREIDLLNEARKPLYDYLQHGKRARESHYVFTSQREKRRLPDGDLDGWRLTEDGIHQWFQDVRAQASVEEAELIDDITFHDLRHDFGHRLREQGWNLEEIAYYLGHITAAGTPAIQTTVRYTQVGREQVKEKLRRFRAI